MILATLDKEDVVAGLRKRFRSVAAFERAKALPEKSVHDLLRGRASARVQAAVEDALSKPVTPLSEVSDGNTEEAVAHRLNAGGR